MKSTSSDRGTGWFSSQSSGHRNTGPRICQRYRHVIKVLGTVPLHAKWPKRHSVVTVRIVGTAKSCRIQSGRCLSTRSKTPPSSDRILEAVLLIEKELELAALLRHVIEEAASMDGPRYQRKVSLSAAPTRLR